MPTDFPDESIERRVRFTVSWPSLMLVLGVGLVVASFIPLDEVASNSQWTEEDAHAYERISVEYHRSSHQTPARAGLTQAELDQRHADLEKRFEKMRTKLEHARSRPKAWSRYLLVGGALLSALGALAHARKG